MPIARANGIDLFYERIGDDTAPVIILIMGLGTQMIAWPDAFCGRLADSGFQVVRFDNRDIGHSSKFETAKKINLVSAFARVALGRPVAAPYTLNDMALDVIGLMDALKIERAHMVGASMGGMIAQILAARHPDRCRSLVSIMSTSGDPGLPRAKPAASLALMAPRPPRHRREASIRFGMRVYRTIGSPGYRTPDNELRAKVELAFDRSYYPQGAGRQLLAVLAGGSRAELLKSIRVPTLVLHGRDDPLVPVEGGMDTAGRIPGAELEIIAGWGHDLPTALLPRLAAAIAAHCKKADGSAS